MQFGATNITKSFLRFNAIERTANGDITNAVWHTLVLDESGNVGINLGPNFAALPNYPTAKFHTNGTVRHQNLPTGTGNVLVADANGNVFRSSTVLRQTEMEEEITELKKRLNH